MDSFKHPLIGYRVWNLLSETLCSRGYGNTAWRPQLNLAYCHRHAEPPDKDCECGLYANYSAADIERQGVMPHLRHQVFGTILASGRTELHRDGFRCSEAIITGIYLSEERLRIPTLEAGEEFKDHALRTARKYSIPVFHDLKGLQEYNLSLGGKHLSPFQFKQSFSEDPELRIN